MQYSLTPVSTQMFCTHLNQSTIIITQLKPNSKTNFNINSYRQHKAIHWSAISRWSSYWFWISNGLWICNFWLGRDYWLLNFSNSPHHKHNNRSQKHYANLSCRSKITVDSKLFKLITSISAADDDGVRLCLL